MGRASEWESDMAMGREWAGRVGLKEQERQIEGTMMFTLVEGSG